MSCGGHTILGNSGKEFHYRITEVELMEIKKPNHCISCSVKNCAHHAQTENYCSLEKVVIGTHEKNPTVVQCVDCESFVLGGCASGSCETR